MPIEYITAENMNKIRILDLVAFLCQSLKNFFKIELPKNARVMGEVV